MPNDGIGMEDVSGVGVVISWGPVDDSIVGYVG